MAIRTREEALRALEEILRLGRAQQIVRLTARLAECSTREARQVLLKAQEGIVQGNLSARSAISRAKSPDSRPRIKLHAEEKAKAAEAEQEDAKLQEEILAALEALKVAVVAFDLFPAMAAKFARWEAARAARAHPDRLRRVIRAATDPDTAREAEEKLARTIQEMRPWWHDQCTALEEACVRTVKAESDPRWRAGPTTLMDVIAVNDLRAVYPAKGNPSGKPSIQTPLARVYRALTQVIRALHPSRLPEGSPFAL